MKKWRFVEDSSTKTDQLSGEVTILYTTDHAGNPPMRAVGCCQVQQPQVVKIKSL